MSDACDCRFRVHPDFNGHPRTCVHRRPANSELRVGLDITDRKLRLEALAQELRSIGEMLDGRDWVQRSKLKEITSRIETISEELERPWKESDTGDYESVAPSH